MSRECEIDNCCREAKWVDVVLPDTSILEYICDLHYRSLVYFHRDYIPLGIMQIREEQSA